MSLFSRPDGRHPCVIGVAAHTWRGGDAPEPLEMWQHVVRHAAADSGRASGVLAAVDELAITYCQTWQYDDPTARLANALQLSPRRKIYSGVGGTSPQQLLNDAADAIRRGELDVAVVVSAEALGTQRVYKQRGERPVYSYRPQHKPDFPWESRFLATELAHGVLPAWLTFAMLDNARRAHLEVSLLDYRRELGEMMAKLCAVAATNPHAWFPTLRTSEQICNATHENRLVGYPYTKHMVAVMDVDMAAAVVLASTDAADELGVATDRRVFLNGYGASTDAVYIAERPDLWRSPAMVVASRRAFAQANVAVDDVGAFDLYSCFGSSVNFARDALELADDDPRPLTVTGGLPYHGGPGSGYMTHSIAAMVERLRADAGSIGCVSGVGMHMTKHVFAVYSSAPRSNPNVTDRPADEHELRRLSDGLADGGHIAAYSVVHGRDGIPTHAVVVCDLDEGARCYAMSDDPELLSALETEELIGTEVDVRPQPWSTPVGDTTKNVVHLR